jgi:hypothetical protein
VIRSLPVSCTRGAFSGNEMCFRVELGGGWLRELGQRWLKSDESLRSFSLKASPAHLLINLGISWNPFCLDITLPHASTPSQTLFKVNNEAGETASRVSKKSIFFPFLLSIDRAREKSEKNEENLNSHNSLPTMCSTGLWRHEWRRV